MTVAACQPAPAPTTASTPTPAPTSTPTSAPTSTLASTSTLAPTSTPVSTSTSTSVSTPTPVPTFTPAPLPDSVKLRLVAEGFASPVGLVPSLDGTGRLFVVDQAGIIWVLTAAGNRLGEPFLDLRSRMVSLNQAYDERGLLGLAFHPSYRDNGRLFVYYSAPLRNGGPQGWNHTSHISEFGVVPGDANKADPASERVILQVDQPQSNHNAGTIVFGPDGYLYIPLGDGGAANDVGLGHPPMGNGQDTSTLLGSILRIDIDAGEPYGIPEDNPFVGKEGRDEIFAFGFRNPFRISFDMGGSHELFAADVGQNLWEEVDIVTMGANYGWNIKEGAHFFDPQNPGRSPATGPDVDASGQPLLDPIIEYGRGEAGGLGTAVIGGYVYRGSAIAGLQGAYVFGDFSASGARADGRLFLATRPAEADAMWPMKELGVATAANGRLGAFLRAFGQDADGELYVLTADVPGPQGATGKIYRIVP
ncbi:MAG: PQQ-dependent sugar dehydrogenase [Chloroflexi bacterium]|nr:PQQ-dependent sugar dehydrogenase [Chloroflexota bacterium]